MRILVTGGAGYVGSVIVEELVKSGHTPVVYDSLVKGHAQALPPTVPLLQADVRDTARLTQALRDYQIEAVIHMAALIEAGLSVIHPEQFYETNVGGGMSVLRAMVDTGLKKLVISSTASLYGDTTAVPITEEVPLLPTNPYGDTKLVIERLFDWGAAAHGLTCTALRYFNAAGATENCGELHAPESHLIPLVLQAAAADTSVCIFGTDYPTPDGTTIRDYIHVADLAQAHLLALHRIEPGMRTYNVGSGTGYSVRQVIETARQVTGRALPIDEQPRRPGDQVISVASAERIRRELGWQPRYTELHTIIASAWQWRLRHPHGYAEE